jgi:hypothetical protein
MRQSDDPKDRVIAEIGERLANLESAVRVPKPMSEQERFSSLMDRLREIALPLKQAKFADDVIASALVHAANLAGFPLEEIRVNSKENLIDISANKASGRFLIDINEATKIPLRK